MPPIQSKVEGRGNGIKTAIVNLAEVARALGRPSTYVLKYFGSELGAQTNESQDRFLINGSHDAGELQDSLDGFINKFVLCASCKNPETEIQIKKGLLQRDCKACGHLSMIDPRTKLSSYILKNPPTDSGKGKKGKKAATATANVVGGGKSISDIVGNKPETNGDEPAGDDDDDALTKLINHNEEFEKAFLGGLERYIGLENTGLIEKVPKILVTVYDKDLISEDTIIAWGSKVSKKYVPKEVSKKVRKAAKPFVKWLQEADEDSDEE